MHKRGESCFFLCKFISCFSKRKPCHPPFQIKEETPAMNKQSSALSSTASSFSAPPLAVHSITSSQSLTSVHSQVEAKKPLTPNSSSSTNMPQYTRPSAQVSPYTSTPIMASTAPSHSVINVDAGTTARGEKGILTSKSQVSLFYKSFISIDFTYFMLLS